jgi:hypothetical protein
MNWETCTALDLRHNVFVGFCNQYGLFQFVIELTRLTHILDLVLGTKQDIVFSNTVSPPCISDYNILCFTLNVSGPPLHLITMSKHIFDKATYKGLSLAFKTVN